MTQIEFENVYFRYNDDETWTLKNVSFQINKGETIAIIGRNGSGKSTVAKLMNGLLLPQSGTIYIDGMKVTPQTIFDIRQKVGMVFQNPENQFVGTTVLDDVAFGLENRGIPREEMIRRIDESLTKVGMSSYKQHEAHHLSGGQKQRVAIAGVIAIYPEILILDEATSMLDPIGRKSILETIDKVKQENELTCISITHDMNELSIANRVFVFHEGRLEQDTTPRHFFSSTENWETYGLLPPLLTQFTKQIEKNGILLHTHPLTHEELIRELWK
jgi:energy-coupling factor transport system ATP-binding protein